MQLYWLQVLSTYRTSFFNFFFEILNFFDTFYFFFFLLPFIWFTFSHKWGIRILYLCNINALINFLLKSVFQVPRPSVVDPNLALLKVDELSFPSGAAQYSMLLGCVLMYYNKNLWAKIVGISFILLMGFSRLYLGVHYPTDILGGWFFGIILFLVFKKILPSVERKVSSNPALYLVAFVASVTFFNIFFFSQTTLLISSVLIFSSIGIYISKKYSLYLSEHKKLTTRYLQSSFVIGVILIFLVIFYLGPTHSFSKLLFMAVLLTFWLTLFASPVIKRIKFLN